MTVSPPRSRSAIGSGQDVQQQPLVLAMESQKLSISGDVGAVDVDEPELGDIHRQELVFAALAAQLDTGANAASHGHDQPLEELTVQVPPDGAAHSVDEVGAGRVRILELAVPADPEDRVGVLVRELDDRPARGDVRPVDVEETELGHLDRAQLERPQPGDDLDGRALPSGLDHGREPRVRDEIRRCWPRGSRRSRRRPGSHRGGGRPGRSGARDSGSRPGSGRSPRSVGGRGARPSTPS